MSDEKQVSSPIDQQFFPVPVDLYSEILAELGNRKWNKVHRLMQRAMAIRPVQGTIGKP